MIRRQLVFARRGSMRLACRKNVGRGLGISGGTIDNKLESIPGIRVDLKTEESKNSSKTQYSFWTGQVQIWHPADGKLCFRDVTERSSPSVIAHLMSKKKCCGTDAIVLDVKVAKGAF